MELIQDLGVGPVGLDTAVFIYFMEEHPRYLPIVEPIFAALDEQRLAGVTTTITLLETLVVPLRAGDVSLARSYEALLGNSRGLGLIDLDRSVILHAAKLRATNGLKTPDALQVAAALQAGCTAFVTNDRRIPEVRGLRVFQLREYL